MNAEPVPPPVLVKAPEAVPWPRLALGLVAGFAAVKLLAQLVAIAVTPYGIHRDEFLYLSMGEHLRLWCWDFPPIIALLAKAARGLFGDTLFAIRFFPAIAGTCVLVLAGVVARELGGGRFAQGLAMLTILFGPLFLRSAGLFHPVVFDQLCWTLGFLALIKIAQGATPRWWVVLGVAGGLGLLTKFSIGFFALAALAAMLLTPQRRALATPWPWLAVMVALLVGSPSIIGQVRLDFPVVFHMRDLQSPATPTHHRLRVLPGTAPDPRPGGSAGGGGTGSSAREPVHASVPGDRADLLDHVPDTAPPAWEGVLCRDRFTRRSLRREPWRLEGSLGVWAGRQGWWLSGLWLHGGRLAFHLVCPWCLPRRWLAMPPPWASKPRRPPTAARRCLCRRITRICWAGRTRSLPWRRSSSRCRLINALKAVLVASNYGQAGALEFFGPRHGLPRRVLVPGNNLLWALPPGKQYDVAVTIGIPPEVLGRFLRTVRLA